jgi:hypothetical protein
MRILLVLAFLVALIPQAQARNNCWWNGYAWVCGDEHERGEWRDRDRHEHERHEWCEHHPGACR